MSRPLPQTDLDVLRMIAAAPIALLGDKSISRLNAFVPAYWNALPPGQPFSFVRRVDFENLVRSQIPTPERWPYNAKVESYLEFLGPTQADAFDRYAELIERYHTSTESKVALLAAPTGGKLAIWLETLSKHSVMYFGNRDKMGCIIAFLNGWIASEMAASGVSATATLLDDFQGWMEKRHAWSQGRPWHAILMLQNLWDDEGAIRGFRTFFDMFLKGEAAEALTPTAKHLFDTNPAVVTMK